MKLKYLLNDEKTQRRLLLCAASLILSILALCFGGKAAWKLILSLLGFVLALIALLPDLYGALRARDFRSGLLLLAAGAVLNACVGRAVSAAWALLLWQLGQMALRLLTARLIALLDERRGLGPLKDRITTADDSPQLAARPETLLRDLFSELMIVIAAIAAVLTGLSAGVGEALKRAGVILSLGGTAALFAAFPLSDYAAVLRAGEAGILFRAGALTRLLGLKLVCAAPQEPVMFGSAAVYPSQPESFDAELMVRLAAYALSGTESPFSEKLEVLCPLPSDAVNIQRQELEGFGVVAKRKGLVFLCGSAEFMAESGLSAVPFSGSDRLLHLAANGRYIGCIDFFPAEEAAAAAALEAAGFFRFSDEAEAAKKRLPGEQLLHISSASALRGAREGDLLAALGQTGSSSPVIIERCGCAGVCALAEQLQNARLGRKGSLLVTLITKAVLLLLAVFGICPLWIAVLGELAAVAFTERYALHLLDTSAEY